jgi:AmmeMemoRadiSam system protein A
MEFSPATRAAMLEFAGRTIVHRLGGHEGQIALPPDPLLGQPMGCFVSLHRWENHALRGCIGILESDRPLSQALANAAEGALADPRFINQPITLSELPFLRLELTVIGPMRPVASPLEFQPLEDGIYLTIGPRSGVFLPQVARETGWTREQLLSRLCQEKLGFPPDAWKQPDAALRVFSTVVIGPVPLLRPEQKMMNDQ